MPCPYPYSRIKSARTAAVILVLALIVVSWSGNLVLTENWLVVFRHDGPQLRVVKVSDRDAPQIWDYSSNNLTQNYSTSGSRVKEEDESLAATATTTPKTLLDTTPTTAPRVDKDTTSPPQLVDSGQETTNATLPLISQAPILVQKEEEQEDSSAKSNHGAVAEDGVPQQLDSAVIVRQQEKDTSVINETLGVVETTDIVSSNDNMEKDLVDDSAVSSSLAAAEEETTVATTAGATTTAATTATSTWHKQLFQAWQAFEKDSTSNETKQQEHVNVIVRQERDDKPQHDVTVVTFATTDKLPRLLDMLTRWTGPVAMAVYFAKREDIQALAAFHDQHYNQLANVTIHVLFENPTTPIEQTYLPEGALRNLAMNQVDTNDFLIHLNVEYVTNKDCYEILLKMLRTNPRVRAFLEDRHFMVLPAFQSSRQHEQESLETVPSTKPEMIQRKVNRTAELVPMPLLPRDATDPTMFDKWARGGPGDMFVTEFKPGFEPVVLTHHKVIPLYNENLRGPWYSQISHMDEANWLKYNFGVLWRAFVYRIDRRQDSDPEPFAQEQYQRFGELLRKMYDYPLIVHTVHNLDRKGGGSCRLAGADDRNETGLEQRVFCEWQNFTASDDLRRQLVSVIHPNRKKSVDGDITLATQGSVDRLNRLVETATRWSGPISAAVYVTRRDSLSNFFDFYRQNCAILKQTSFHLFFEKINTVRDKQYPHNYLRNLAMNNIDTEFVINTDIDFCVNANAYPGLVALVQSDNVVRNSLENRTMLVLPAFENTFHLEDEDVSLAPKDKAEVTRQVKELNTAEAFHLKKYYAGHGATNYEKWYANKTASVYFTEYEHGFEPYVLAKKEGLPQFWVGFRGFGYNKRAWLEEAHRMGYKYGVLRDYFVFHVGQSSTAVRPQGWASREYNYRFSAHLDKLYPKE